MILGSAMGSFAVERFSVRRFIDLTADEINDRVNAFRTMMSFEYTLTSPTADV